MDQATLTARPSPFFHNSSVTQPGSLAILHLKRDSLLPTTLKESDEDGYAEGAVTNTRFGSFPHSTLIGLEWGSQVRASKVDTGSRGRKGKKGKKDGAGEKDVNGSIGGVPDEERRKRKADETDRPSFEDSPVVKKTRLSAEGAASPAPTVRTAVEAGSGFTHILLPTPEAWTSSLDHRTQIVYTPDYSYILQRLRVRPGTVVIEAGAGSGSFTHAAARAVYSGRSGPADALLKTRGEAGRIYSFEFHEPRVQTLQQEINEHGLDEVVHLTHWDVCTDGFTPKDLSSPNAEAVFLDLPAPWLALKHLRRSPASVLSLHSPVYLCTFSPCTEQVQATISCLRADGWTEIEMVEVQNRRIDVRREQVGLHNEGLRGVNAAAATVEEAVRRLKEVDNQLIRFNERKLASKPVNGSNSSVGESTGGGAAGGKKVETKAERLKRIQSEAEARKVYKEGNLVHRTEPEVRTHTSYLVFAVLPREWSEADEQACLARWALDKTSDDTTKDTPDNNATSVDVADTQS